MKKQLPPDIFYIGVNDHEIDLFEGQYVVPNGVSYNSYVIQDDKIAVMDTVDAHKTHEWLDNLSQVLGEKSPDYLVVLHMEPDHAGSLRAFLEKYPTTQVVSNAKVFQMIPQYFEGLEVVHRQKVVAENDTLSLGKHTLRFIMAPMVHWPEVMMAYEEREKILFSADGFGKFGALDVQEDWTCEARRYYFNIVGKYGAQVQAVLKKAAGLEIQKIFPLHGPMLMENLGYYLNKYDIWSSYQPEDKGVFIAYTSVYGHTKEAVLKLQEMLVAKGVKVSVCDLARQDMAEALEDAFRYDKMVLASTTYDAGIFPAMESFIAHLKAKNYQNRSVGFIENGSWVPQVGKKMKAELESLKNITFVEPMVTLKAAMKSSDLTALQALADHLA